MTEQLLDRPDAHDSRLRRAAVANPNEPKSTRPRSRARFRWAELMQRVFEIDVTVCPRCGTAGMQAIACITQADVVRKILECIGQPTAPPAFDPPVWPPDEGAFDQAA